MEPKFLIIVSQGSNKYLFECPYALEDTVEVGDLLLVNTIRGEQLGVAVSPPMAVRPSQREKLLKEFGTSEERMQRVAGRYKLIRAL